MQCHTAGRGGEGIGRGGEGEEGRGEDSSKKLRLVIVQNSPMIKEHKYQYQPWQHLL